jgi:type IV pilus assembly protein PilB
MTVTVQPPEGFLPAPQAGLAADPAWRSLDILDTRPYSKLDTYQMRSVMLTGWARGQRPLRALLEAGYDWDLLNLFMGIVVQGLEVVDLGRVRVQASTVAPFPLELARTSHVLPIHRDDNTVIAATSSISNMEALRELEVRFPNLDISLVLAEPGDIEAVVDQLMIEAEATNVAELAQSIEMSTQLVEEDDDSSSDAAVVQLARSLVEQALNTRSSDIHIDPQPGRGRGSVVRFRIDGVLVDMPANDIRLHPPLTNYFKARANMDIANRRVPQDGSYRVKIAQGEPLHMRVATMPTGYRLGDTVLEKITLRLVATDSSFEQLPDLGFSQTVQQSWERLLQHHAGMIVVTGPTGSGKTTTMYASLGMLAVNVQNVMTIEDPIERRISGANQTQVNLLAGMTYPAAMRGFLRHDPDVILVGEMRDAETARIAIEAALAGRLLLTSTHAPSAAGVIARLLSMGMEPYMVASALQGVLAQRLIRTLCPRCKQPETALNLADIPWPMPPDQRPQEGQVFSAHGCVVCKGIGYKGRMAVGEVLVMDETLERMICADTPTREITAYARQQGMVTLNDDALLKAAQGLTSLEECARVAAS